MSSNLTTTPIAVFSHESKLLIPESIAWMPYVGLVLVVLLALGLDFYKFHQKNRVKYACMKEHASIVSHSPKRQRICMISGVGLKFKKGKPVLGDVWNTSPSSSELSSYSPWRDGDGEGCYSREITPSDDGGGCGFYDTRERLSHGGNSTNPFRSLLNSDEDEDAYREPTAWSLGGEIIGGSTREKTGDDSLHSYGFSVLGSETEGQTAGKGQGNDSKGQVQRQQKQIVTSVTVEPKRLQTSTPAGDVPSSQRTLCDASTQTDPMEVNYNIDLSDPPPRYVPPLRPGSGGGGQGQRRGPSMHFLGEHDYQDGGCPPPPSPRPHSPYHPVQAGYSSGHHHKSSRRMTVGGPGLSPPMEPQPTVIDFSPRPHSGDRSRDSSSNPATPRQPRSKMENRRRHDLGLDIFNSPRSPTTEIVAKDHGFELAGIEVPYVSSGPSMSSAQQSNSGTGSGGGGTSMFKAPGMQVQSKSFIRPVVSASATSSPLNASGFKYKTESSSALSEAVDGGSSAIQRQSYRRVHSLSMEMDESHSHHPSSARSLPAVPAGSTKGHRRTSHGQMMRTPHSGRPSSSSPRPRKERHGAGSRSKLSIGGGVDDGGGGSREEDIMKEEDDDTIGGAGAREREDEESGKPRSGGSGASPRSTPSKLLTVPGSIEDIPDVEARPVQQGNSFKHPQLRHQREPREGRQQQQHHSHHLERRDSHQKKKLSSQSFSPGSSVSRRKSDRTRRGSGAAGGEKGLKSASPSIPTHLYHEDEEGFFSSTATAAHAALNRGVSSGAGPDHSRKGILFFSRLAGVGRHCDPSSGGGRKTGGGGFES